MADVEQTKNGRLDHYLVQKRPALSRAFITKLIDQGKVTVNNKIQTKAGYKLHARDKVQIDYMQPGQNQLPSIDLPVIYEDDDCVVVNKPAGVLTHSKGDFNPEATVATWLKGRLKGLDGDRAGIVHRLDRATSGVMICAKTAEAQNWLQKQFSQRKVKKIYVALVNGQLEPAHAIIDMPIERNPRRPQTFRVGTHGRQALTEYKVLSSKNDLSLIELKPTTGRTHQLRVHLNQIKHPILGDTLYGGQSAERLFLHAQSLEITLPSRQRKKFTVLAPQSFSNLVK